MKQLIIEIDDKKKEFSIPSDWSEISIKKYRELLTIDESNSVIEQRMKCVSILIGVDMEILEQIYAEDFKLLEEAISWIIKLEQKENGLEWVIGEIPQKKVEYIELNNEKYYAYTDFNKLTMGEDISLKIIIEQTQGNILLAYNKLLCILLRKKTENGKLEKFKSDHMSRAEMFDDVSIEDVHNLFVFFSTGENI